MQIFYSMDNINKVYWAWCIKRQYKQDKLLLFNNITRQDYILPLGTLQNVQQIDQVLCNGIEMFDLIRLINSFGIDGEYMYSFLMQNGVLE